MGHFSETLMDHFHSPRNTGRMDNPDLVGLAGTPGNGPYLVLYIRLDDASIVESCFQTHGCGVSIACGSMLTELIAHRTVAECLELAPEHLTLALDGVPRDETPLPGLGHRRAQGRTQELRNFSMTGTALVPQHHATVAFGPEAPGWGSWDWVGSDLARALARDFTTRLFRAWEEPECDVIILIKHPPRPDWIERVARGAAIIYAPVDAYDSAAAIDADAAWLRKCARIVIHCDRLRKYFAPYATVEYVDHHVKFAAPVRESFQPRGNLLWVGVRSNLTPLIRWVNAHDLPAPLDVLSNFEDPGRITSPTQLGFRTDAGVRIHHWSPERQTALTTAALRGASTSRGTTSAAGTSRRPRRSISSPRACRWP